MKLYLTRPMDSFSATAKYANVPWCPQYDAKLSRWMFTAHSLQSPAAVAIG
jgi:hypothetical protein